MNWRERVAKLLVPIAAIAILAQFGAWFTGRLELGELHVLAAAAIALAVYTNVFWVDLDGETK